MIAAGIGDLNLDLMLPGRLMIQLRTLLHPQLVTDDLEVTGRVAGDGIAEALTCILVSSGEVGHQGACIGILINFHAAEGDISGRLVDIGDIDGETFRMAEATSIGDADRHPMRGVGLVVDIRIRLYAQLITDDLKMPGWVIEQCVSECLTIVHIGGGEGGRDGTTGGVFHHLGAVDANIIRPLVDIVDIDVKSFSVTVASGIGDPHAHLMAVGTLMIHRTTTTQAQLVAHQSKLA